MKKEKATVSGIERPAFNDEWKRDFLKYFRSLDSAGQESVFNTIKELVLAGDC